MELNVVWFVLVAVLFIGFFFLEGFDYGVGMLVKLLGRDDTERGMLVRTIGPVWDGNEVWMITAGGAMFAAFPHVYATMFSGFYLALFVLLLALIMRGVAFEFRGQDKSPAWRTFWDWSIFFGSAVPALLWGVAVANLIAGVPINEKMIYVGTFFDLLTPYTLVTGVAFLLVFLYHGSAFVTLKVVEPLAGRARDMALYAGGLALFAAVACLGLTALYTDAMTSAPALIAFVLAAILLVLSYLCMLFDACKKAFIFSSLSIAMLTIGFFAGLFPRLMVSSLNPEWSLTIYNAASTPYTLKIMTIAAVCLVPIVLAYQIWTYWVFRKRVTPFDDAHY